MPELPWEKYQQEEAAAPAVSSLPWERYAQEEVATAPDVVAPEVQPELPEDVRAFGKAITVDKASKFLADLRGEKTEITRGEEIPVRAPGGEVVLKGPEDIRRKEELEAEDSWAEALGKSVIQGGLIVPTTIGAGSRFLNDLLGLDFTGIGPDVPDLYDMSKYADNFWQPKVIEDSVKDYATQSARVMTEMGTAALLTGGAGMLPSLSGSAGLQKYVEAREGGADFWKSAYAGSTQAAIEYSTEKLPISVLLKPGLTFGRRLMFGLITDIPGEIMATSGEMALVDTQILGKHYNLEEYIKAIKDTAIVSAGVTGGMTVGTHPVVKQVEDFENEVKKDPEAFEEKFQEMLEDHAESARIADQVAELQPVEDKTDDAVLDMILEGTELDAITDEEIEARLPEVPIVIEEGVITPEPSVHADLETPEGIAESLDITYNGIQEGVGDIPDNYLFTDKVTGTTFGAETLEEVESRLHEKRVEFGIEEVPATTIPEEKRLISTETYEAAQARIKENLKGLKAGVDPTIIPAMVVSGAYHIETGLRTFKAWSEQMIKEYGKKIKPILQGIWEQSQQRANISEPGERERALEGFAAWIEKKENDKDFDKTLNRLRSGNIPSERQAHGKSIVEFLRDLPEGIEDTGGELKAMDVDADLKPFQRKMIREDGVDPDIAAQAAAESGYFPGLDSTTVTPNDLFEAIDNDLAGTPVYSDQFGDDALADELMNFEELDRILDDARVDLSMSNAEIRTALEGGDPASLKKAAGAAPGIKKQIAKATGIKKVSNLIREDEALSAAWKKAEQAARVAFREGNKEGVVVERQRMKDILVKAKGRLTATATVNKLRKSILKEIKSTKVKKVGGKPVGKFTADVQKVLDGFRDAIKLTEQEAIDKIADNLDRYTEFEMPDAVVVENRILNMVVKLQKFPEPKDQWAVKPIDSQRAVRVFDTEDEAIEYMATQQNAEILEIEERPAAEPKARLPLRKQFTVDELENILEGIKALKTEGKMLTEFKKFTRQERDARLRSEALNVILGGEELPAGLESVGIEQKKPSVKEFKNWLTNFASNSGIHFVGWNDLIDMLSVRDKTSKPGKSRLSEVTEVHSAENAEKAGQSAANKKIVDFAKKSFNFENDRAMLKQFNLDAKEIEIGSFINAKDVRVDLKMTKAEARKFMMEYADPVLRDTFYDGMSFTDDMIKAVNDTLTAQDKIFMQEQLNFYRNYYDRVNNLYRDIYGVDLPFNEFYSPVKREGFDAPDGKFGEFLDEVAYRRSVTTGSLKSRVKNVRRLASQSDVNVLERHIAEMEHFIAWSDKVRDLNAIFKNPEVRAAISLHHEPSMLFAVDKFINDFTRGGVELANRLNNLDKIRGLFTRSVLAVKPNITIKQLTSQVAYMEVMPIKDYVAGTLDFWKHPVKNFKFLKENSVWFAERGGNMERDIKTAMRMKEYNSFRESRGFMDSLMLNVQLGDQGAIAIGGWSYYKYLRKKGVSKKDAILEFEKFSEQTQQSADLSIQSHFQRKGSVSKLFTMFLSSPNLYMRKELGAIRNLLAGRGSVKDHMKTITIYHLILPMFFQWVSDAFDWDEKEQLRAVILGPLNGIFIVGDGIDYIIRKALGLRTFSKEVALYSGVNDLGKFVSEAVEYVADGSMTDEDFYRASSGLAGAMGSVTGLPLKQTVNTVKTGQDFLDGEFEKAVKELLGYSPGMLETQEKRKPQRR